MIHRPDRLDFFNCVSKQEKSITSIMEFDYFYYVELVTEPAVERKSISLSSHTAKYSLALSHQV